MSHQWVVGSPQHNESALLAGMRHLWDDASPAMPISPGSREPGTDSSPWAGSGRSANPAFLPNRTKDASTVDISGVAGRGYVVLDALAETALARKCRHPKDLRCHCTFGIGAHFLSSH